MKAYIFTNIKRDKKSSRVLAQLKSICPVLAAFFLPVLLFLGILVSIEQNTNIPMYYFMRDPSQTLDVPSYIGLASNVGTFLWCFCIAICLFSFIVLRKKGKNGNVSRFFLFSGLLTAIVMLDDFFVLHESISIHIEGILSYALYSIPLLYVLPLIFILLRYIKVVLNTDYLLLTLGGLFFALSLLVDLNSDLAIISFNDDLRILLEDGCKLLGITAWLAYFARAGFKYITLTKSTEFN